MLSSFSALGATPPPKFDGAFLWVGNDHVQWTGERWKSEFGWMRQLGFKTVIVSGCVHEKTAIYPTSIPGLSPAKGDAVLQVLNHADANGMDVHLGLVGARRWWSDTSEAFLDELTSLSKATASELYDRYKSHPSLHGFYITGEIDNMTWVDEILRKRLAERFLKPVSDHIKSLNKSLVVSEAPFFNIKFQGPEEYGKWWEKTFKEVPNLDLLIPQDGIGVKHAELADVKKYFGALRDACKANGRVLWSDLEIFEQQQGGHSKPAGIKRIIEQLAVEKPFVEKIVFWEFGSYLSPGQSSQAAELFNQYLNYLNGGQAFSTLPGTGPTSPSKESAPDGGR
ncbi:MAG: DUF4434 domain-containing protein [bacterium]|nr:DUF4434 domain-containing protein [Candidatus Sumerlaeota bacterium]